MTFLWNMPSNPEGAMLLAHGAGAPMDTQFMSVFAELLCAARYAVARCEFAYMTARRQSGIRKPPPRAERLIGEFNAAIDRIDFDGPLIVGGKSLGGRVASLVSQDRFEAGRVSALVCLGYPFHPPGKPHRLRTAHLLRLTLPVLIIQGERDPFGGRDEVAGYGLPENITLHWAGDGDHDLVPRKKSGRTKQENWIEAVQVISNWADRNLR